MRASSGESARSPCRRHWGKPIGMNPPSATCRRICPPSSRRSRPPSVGRPVRRGRLHRGHGDSQPFTVDSNLTASAATAIAAANSITASGGGDIPEDQINALYQVGSGAIGFRPDSTRLVVWFGDAMGHDPSNGKTINDAITALNGVSAKVLAINVDTGFASTALDASGQATQIATATGGAYLGTVGATEVSSKILEGLTNLDATVTAVPTCDPGLSVSLSPASQTVPSGTSATFDEAITVAAGATRVRPCTARRTSSSTDSTPAPPSCSRSPSRSMTSPRRPSPAAPVSTRTASPAGLPERRVLSTRGRRQPAGRHGHRVGHQSPVRASDPMRRTRRSS